uniref:Enhancer of rudimentary homolog n=1 Tax=Panagrellus redivivus TaxID=6233 RepID=A0A7E4W3I5_PANRE
MSHTILLVQSTENVESRTWTDYETTNECLEAICKIYEEHLKKLNPVGSLISYEATDLLKFLDRLADISILVLNRRTHMYMPKSRDWIKTEIFALLRQQIESGATNDRSVLTEIGSRHV